MIVGDLAKIVWTEGCVPDCTIVGVVTEVGPEREDDTWRQLVELFFEGKRHWLMLGELKVVAGVNA